MRQMLMEWNCKYCGFHTYIKTHRYVAASIEKRLVEHVKDGSLFYYRCPNCQKTMRMIHPFLYYHSEKKYLLCMDIERKDALSWETSQESLTIRFVEDPRQLQEKIRLFDSDLDDRIMELIKYKLKKQLVTVLDLIFDEYDKETNTIWFLCSEEQQVNHKAILYQTYLNYRDKYRPLLEKEDAYYIDEQWAKQCSK